MTEKTTRNYVRQAIRPDERDRVDDALRVFEHALRNLRFLYLNKNADLEIHLKNRQNPNGFTIRLGANGKPKVERYINLAWARRHGYVDAYNTASGRKRRKPAPVPESLAETGRRPDLSRNEESCSHHSPRTEAGSVWGCERQAGHPGKHMAWDKYPSKY